MLMRIDKNQAQNLRFIIQLDTGGLNPIISWIGEQIFGGRKYHNLTRVVDIIA